MAQVAVGDVTAGRGLAVAALTIGVLGVGLGLIPILFVPVFILGLVAIVLGWVARSQARTRTVARQAFAGAACGAVACLLACLGLAIVGGVFKDVSTQNCLRKAHTTAEMGQCFPND